MDDYEFDINGVNYSNLNNNNQQNNNRQSPNKTNELDEQSHPSHPIGHHYSNNHNNISIDMDDELLLSLHSDDEDDEFDHLSLKLSNNLVVETLP